MTFLILFFLLAGISGRPVFADISIFRGNRYSQPELLAPCTDNFHLKDQTVVEFRWQPDLSLSVRHYIFKLYRGYQTRDENLMSTRELPAGSYSLSIPAGDFSAGKVYTWELTGVLFDGRKTDTAFCSFQIKD